jgi:hypothetical protein
MTNVVAQHPAVATYSGATSVSKAFASTMTNPSLLVAALTMELNAGTATVKDTTNTLTMTLDSSGTSGSAANNVTGAVYSLQNTHTAAITITASPISASTSGTLSIFEITGAPTSSALDVQNGTGGLSSNNTITVNSLAAHDSVIAACPHYPAGAVVDSGYTASFTEAAGSNAYHFGEYIADQGSGGSITLTVGLGSEQAWAMAVAAYKTSGAVDPLLPQICI